MKYMLQTRMTIRVVLSIGLICPIFGLYAQDWTLTKSNDQVKVYTAKMPASKFKVIKVEALMDGSLQKLVNVLKDVNNNKRWVYKTKRSYKIDSVDTNDFRYYAETSVPWPLSNRDMVIRMQFMPDTVNHELQVQATGLPQAISEKNGIVRVKQFEGLWKVRQKSNGKLAIDYVLKIDPGGSISPGISNLFASNGPFETFNNLSKLLVQ